MNIYNLIQTNLNKCFIQKRFISASLPLHAVYHRSRLRCVDNSPLGKQAMAEGRPPLVIHCYTKKRVGKLGDKVMVAVKGQKKKGYIVGCVNCEGPFIPKFDSNNVVLIEDNGNPSGTRIAVPIPNYLRSKGSELNKIIAIATKFV